MILAVVYTAIYGLFVFIKLILILLKNFVLGLFVKVFQKWICEPGLADQLQACQCDEFIFDDPEDTLKAGHSKNAFGGRGDVAEDDLMAAIYDLLPELEQLW